MTKTKESYETRLLCAEQAAMGDKPPEFRAFIETDPRRAETIREVQRCDSYANDADRLDDLRRAAAEARQAVRMDRTGPGRPSKTDAEVGLEEYLSNQSNAAYDAEATIDTWGKYCTHAFEAWQEAQQLPDLAEQQRRYLAAVLDHVAKAIESWKAADAAQEQARGILRKNADVIVAECDQFITLQDRPQVLESMLKRWRTAFDRAEQTAMMDPDEQLAVQEAEAGAAVYRTELQKAIASYRRTPDGKTQWTQYLHALRRLEAGKAAGPMDDHSVTAERVQGVLHNLYRAACAYAGLDIMETEFPRLN